MAWRCVACGQSAPGRCWTLHEAMFATGEPFDYIECEACGTIRIKEVPVDLGRHYPSGYYSLQQLALPSPAGRAARKARTAVWRADLPVLRWTGWPWMPSKLPSWMAGVGFRDPILDVGSGAGAGVIGQLYWYGYGNLTGVDPNVDANERLAPGLRIIKGEVTDLTGEYRLVMSNHSLEHVADPETTLMAMSRRLAPNGRIVVRIPLMGKAAWRRYGTDWVQLDPPRHLTTFSEHGFRTLAERVGLRVRELRHDSTALQFWGSEMVRARSPLSAGPERYTRSELADLERQAKALNDEGEGDQGAFVLSR